MNSKTLLTGFLSIIFGLVCILVIAQAINPMTKLSNAVNESQNLTLAECYVNGEVNDSGDGCIITLLYSPLNIRNDECDVSNVIVTNNDGDILTESTDYYLMESYGQIEYLNTTLTNFTNLETALVSYNYCGEEYIGSPWSRNLISMIIGFFALSVLAVGIVLIIKSFDDISSNTKI